MKLFKSFAIICALVLTIFLVGCGEPEPEKPQKSIEEVKAEVLAVFDSYGNNDNGSFKLAVKKGSEESVVDMTYNYDGGKIGIISLKSVLTNKNGTMSVYVSEGQVYTNRYEQSKTVAKLDDSQAETIANEYSFYQFNEYLILMLNNSFFASATVDSFENNVAKVSLDINAYNIDAEAESEALTTIFDGIKESSSVVLELTYSETTVTGIKVTIEKDVVSTIDLQLFGTGNGEIAIEYPDFSGYTK